MATKGFTTESAASIGPTLRVALDTIDGAVLPPVAAQRSPARADSDDDAVIVRITATDLRAARRATADIRQAALLTGTQHVPLVLVDVKVVIAADVHTAWTQASDPHLQVAPPPDGSSLKYVGTPTGLASLLWDIVAAGVADGVTLLPQSAETHVLIVDRALPALKQRGVPVELIRCTPHAAA
jgi:hypothetical protein